MSGLGSNRTFPEHFGNGRTSDDSDCEIDGSFIILPNRQSPSSTEHQKPFTGARTPEISLNVFQLGQQQSFHENDPPMTVEVTAIATSASKTAGKVGGHGSEEVDSGNKDGTSGSVLSNLSSCSNDSVGSLEDVNSKVLQLLDENKNLRVFVRELNEKQKNFLENCKALEKAVTSSQQDARDHENKYERSRAVIETLRSKVAVLELELTKHKEQSQTPKQSLTTSAERNETRRLERELAEKDALLQDAHTQIIELKELLRKMVNELSEAKMTVLSLAEPSSLQNERDVLSAAFEDSKVTINTLSDRYLAKEDECKKLCQAMEVLKKEVAEAKGLYQQQVEVNTTLNSSSKEKADEIENLTRKWRTSYEAAKQMEKQMEDCEKTVQDLKNELEKVEIISRQKIAALEAEADDKDALRAQMEEYKSSFEEERRDRVAMKQQKDKLADEVARLQSQLETKNADLNELHRMHLEMVNEHTSSINRRNYDRRESSVDASPRTERFGPLGQVSRSVGRFIGEVFGSGDNVIGSSASSGAGNAGARTSGDAPGTEVRNSVVDEFVVVPPQSAAGVASAPSAGVESISTQPNFSCPICHKAFKTQSAVINHASSCGEVPARRSEPFLFP